MRITIYTQATARHSLGVDAQLLQAALYRLAGDQNVARHKRAHTCIASHRREQASPMSWDVLSQATNGYREAPVCELPMNTSRYMVSQVQAHRVYLLFFSRPLCCQPCMLDADPLLYAFVEPQIQAPQWPCILFAFRTTSATFTRCRADVLPRPTRIDLRQKGVTVPS